MSLCRSLHRALLMIVVVFLPQLVFCQNDSAVPAIRKSIVGQTLTVKIAGIHAATQAFVRPIDTRIVAGTVQKRGLDMFRGSSDVVLAPGTTVQVTKVESSSDNREDVLRVGVNVPGGGYASLAFVSGKGCDDRCTSRASSQSRPGRTCAHGIWERIRSNISTLSG